MECVIDPPRCASNNGRIDPSGTRDSIARSEAWGDPPERHFAPGAIQRKYVTVSALNHFCMIQYRGNP